MSLDARHAKRGKGSHTNKCYIDSKIISYLIQTRIVKRIRLRIPIIIAPISLYQEYEYLCVNRLCKKVYTSDVTNIFQLRKMVIFCNYIRNIYQLFFDGIPFSWNDLITCNTYNVICYLIMKITLLGILYCGFALWRGIYFYFTLNRFEALVMHFLSANVKIIFMTFTISSF